MEGCLTGAKCTAVCYEWQAMRHCGMALKACVGMGAALCIRCRDDLDQFCALCSTRRLQTTQGAQAGHRSPAAWHPQPFASGAGRPPPAARQWCRA